MAWALERVQAVTAWVLERVPMVKMLSQAVREAEIALDAGRSACRVPGRSRVVSVARKVGSRADVLFLIGCPPSHHPLRMLRR